MRHFLVVILLLTSYLSSALNISGEVRHKGAPLAFASIQIANTSKGTICNTNGQFNIILEQKEAKLVASFIGFKNDTILVNDESKSVIFNLEKVSVSLSQLEVNSSNENPAYEIIRDLISHSKKYNQSPDFICDTYEKTIIKENLYYLPNTKETINFRESIGKLHHQSGHFFEKGIAKNDFSTKQKRAESFSIRGKSSYRLANFTPVNPDFYFKSHEQNVINWYNKDISLPRLNENQFISPFSEKGLKSYVLSYQKSFYNEENEEITVISFKGKNSQRLCFEGRALINNTKHYIQRIEFTIPSQDLNYYRAFVISQEFSLVQTNLITVETTYQYGFKNNSRKSGTTTIKYSDFDFNPNNFGVPKNQIKTISKANSDLYVWDSIRPIPLTESESVFVENKLQYEIKKNTTSYQDSINQFFRKPSLENILFQGLRFRNHLKNREISFKPLLNSIQLASFGGLRISISGEYQKQFKNDQSISITPLLSYGFQLSNFKASIRNKFVYDPRKFGAIKLNLSDNYDFLSLNQSLSSIISGSNFVERKYLELSHEFEILNGLYWESEFMYQEVNPLSDVNSGDWRDRFFPDNLAANFSYYRQLNWSNEILIRFNQKFYFEGNKKVIIGSKFPDLRLEFIKSIPIEGISESQFLLAKLEISDHKKWNRFGTSKYSFETGKFLNNQGIKINNQNFFRGSDDWLLSNTLNTFQLLNRSGIRSTEAYFESHLIHHFNGLISQNIKGFKKLKTDFFTGANYLWIDKELNNYTEAYIGIEKEIKLAQQLYRFSLSYHQSINQTFNRPYYIKIGIDWFNFLSENWIN